MTDLGESFKVAIKEAVKEELLNFMKEAIVPEKQYPERKRIITLDSFCNIPDNIGH